jgi:hypothetical protein
MLGTHGRQKCAPSARAEGSGYLQADVLFNPARTQQHLGQREAQRLDKILLDYH